MREIATEELVAAVAREHDAEVAPSRSRHRPGRNRARVVERLPEMLQELVDDDFREGGRLSALLVKRDPEAGGRLPRQRALVMRGIIESDRDRGDARRGSNGGGGDRAR